MSETKKKLENNLSVSDLVGAIGNLSTIKIVELLESLKKEFNISEDAISAGVGSLSDSEKKEEKVESSGNVNLKIIGFSEEKVTTNIGGKLSAYKAVSEISDDLGNKINIIQAKNLVESQGVLAENIDINKAKDIQSKLEQIGINISLITL